MAIALTLWGVLAEMKEEHSHDVLGEIWAMAHGTGVFAESFASAIAHDDLTLSSSSSVETQICSNAMSFQQACRD